MSEYLTSVVERITDGIDDDDFSPGDAARRMLDAIHAEVGDLGADPADP